ncbi:hypothetical protein CGGC5_v015211 [Colletotrichum fructicola Nara gc5]|uniref:Uncharacterized protein n=1 Tax=Colletotrichum fructicola (strain Nara gc5) TaxID=1213859 RepID=A0A7J6IJX1_COLFN|nr:hypothetical protein CGGC5_v015211 [Colletotrichum fructicola Nara gc5]KAF5483397.1 hypothetical protein CGCF413_v015181 [Colletotrichum fructicola]
MLNDVQPVNLVLVGTPRPRSPQSPHFIKNINASFHVPESAQFYNHSQSFSNSLDVFCVPRFSASDEEWKDKGAFSQASFGHSPHKIADLLHTGLDLGF